MTDCFKDQEVFMVATGQGTKGESADQFALYHNLVHEEGSELAKALRDLNRHTRQEPEAPDQGYIDTLVDLSAEVAKEAIDCMVVLQGLLYSMGINPAQAWKQVHTSNMSKLVDGAPVLREDGKVMKGPNYRAPDMRQVVIESWGVGQ
jgi:predicted HAD superfamily Cof-like phosphohydrolase